ncbi:HD domain-containing protein [Salipaludibacillus agaradhaerens]|jgi:HD-GYP domain-containing protein (c-di-GMP phosphodiesterase class II)|uniref:HD-GYP domain-containing protein n=1 Tax=Salipaludibacillus agaradhaerens TaxID=76935 RepID=UPI0021517F50|nr:HD-GYP domain-containing protein [Salipaludibacillus agaradhaerens]MCR6106263.1 HD domain-containing protein [Salipaludibacillus agaradhaerens]MCR6118296.1 HD domain-containing protein [Salipaludibacillus agaradhaerens]UJW57404.1 HD domain-containing protein [Bacillus sp. A116_S68]
MEVINSLNWEDTIIGRVLADDVVSQSGHFLLRRGTVLTHWHLNILKNHSIEEIRLKEQTEPPVNLELKQVFKHKEPLSTHYYENIKEIKRLFQDAISKQVPSLQEFMVPFTPLMETVLKGPDIFLELRHIKGHDEYTFRHCLNVGLLSATIGKILRYSHSETVKLGTMGFLHDIGKMKVSLQILNKEDPLTEEEFKEIQNHTIYGRDILKEMHGTSEDIINGALYHHERMNGSGYPFGIKKEEIPFLAQIIAVADVYDAISSDRIYRDKFTPFEALDELVQEVYKDKLNGEIVFPFVSHILNGYIGKEVELSDGSKGEIVQLFMEEINRPLVKIGDDFIDLKTERKLHIKDVYIPDKNFAFNSNKEDL